MTLFREIVIIEGEFHMDDNDFDYFYDALIQVAKNQDHERKHNASTKRHEKNNKAVKNDIMG